VKADLDIACDLLQGEGGGPRRMMLIPRRISLRGAMICKGLLFDQKQAFRQQSSPFNWTLVIMRHMNPNPNSVLQRLALLRLAIASVWLMFLLYLQLNHFAGLGMAWTLLGLYVPVLILSAWQG